jgi:hypothetical protein
MGIHRDLPLVQQRLQCANMIEVRMRQQDRAWRRIAKVRVRPAGNATSGAIQAAVDKCPAIGASDREHVHEKNAQTNNASRDSIERNDFGFGQWHVGHGASFP